MKSNPFKTADVYTLYCRDLSKYQAFSNAENAALAAEYSETLGLFFEKKEEYLKNHKSDNKVQLNFDAEQYARSFRNLNLRNKLYCHNLKLVITLVTKSNYCRFFSRNNLMDLIGEGNLGLSKAIDYYDVKRNTTLSTCISLWVKAYVIKFILSRRHILKLSSAPAQQKLFNAYNRAQRKLLVQTGKASIEEIAKELNVGVEEVEEIAKVASLTTSEYSLTSCLGENWGHPNPRPIEETIEDPSVEALDSVLAQKEFEKKLPLLLEEFRSQLAEGKIGKFRKLDVPLEVFDLRFASLLQDLDQKPPTLEQIGKDNGLAKQRIAQVEQDLQASLQDYLRPHMSVIASFL